MLEFPFDKMTFGERNITHRILKKNDVLKCEANAGVT